MTVSKRENNAARNRAWATDASAAFLSNADEAASVLASPAERPSHLPTVEASRASCPALPVPESSSDEVWNSGTSQTGQISREASKIILPRTFGGTFESSTYGGQGRQNCHLGNRLSGARITSGSTEN
jgi:hypothetical protein